MGALYIGVNAKGPMPDEMTLTSTTATQEEINEALGITPEPAAQPEAKPEEGKDGEKPQPEQAEGEKQEQEPQQHRSKKPKSAQDRINELTREKYELRERLARLEGAQSRGGDAAEPAKPAPKQIAPTRPKPDPNDAKYKTYDDYVEDLADWKTEQRLAADKAAATEREQNERLREKFDNFRAQQQKAAAKYDDWDEVMSNKDIVLPEVMNVAVVDFENGADVAYYVATHPDFRQHLLDMNDGYSDLKIVHELSRLSDYLLEQENAEEEPANSEKPAATVAAPKPAVSSAPAPIKPIGGASTAANGMKSPDEMTQKEYNRWRDSQKRR